MNIMQMTQEKAAATVICVQLKWWGGEMDKSKYLTTGELAKLSHVTKNTLFHYDKIGLFSPEIVSDNEYRYYSIRQIETLNVIIVLKDLGMPLGEIRMFLEGRTPQRLLELFEKEEKLIQAQMKKLKDRKTWLREKQAQIKNCLAEEPGKILTRWQPEKYYAVSTLEKPTDMAWAEKITELTELYEEKNQSICYEIGYIQHGGNIRRGIYDNYQNVALIMNRRPQGMQYSCLPEGTYLYTWFQGHWRELGGAYRKLLEYADREQLSLAGEFLEVDVLDQLAFERVEDYVLEISVRVEA